MNITEDERGNDMCPICRTDRYLSPNMNFLINPECYHKICESCVDRIFSLGPAPCPYAKCGKILRKNKFKKQIFDDINIEREVDIRKRVSTIYNKTQDDFEDLKDYNQYLENIENIVFNLANDQDASNTEAELVAYEKEHKVEILERQMRQSQKNADLAQYQEAVARLKQEKLKIQQHMEMEDLEFKKQQRQEVLDKLSNSNANSDDIINQATNNSLKRSNSRKRQLQQINNQLEQSFENMIPGNQKKVEEGNKTPFTPFMGDRMIEKPYRMLAAPEIVDINVSSVVNSYYDPFVNQFAKNKEFLGAGWRLEAVYERALEEAFMGLGCFIEEEKKANTT
ncbi:TFIIH/NER complex subunit [Yamadazyma tenuis]|uniref:RNA polymerase II transcription factor B subunit 3 n=1 Tax=Candida tenuis (strain ATCC 10573 / BCRC 21748 / CBS 615 / JCM 9827 / NBRC 10315 / NRRL Y-1498 / VKM Y-70) TaxID=590646 RepID=G3B5G6_CANTC|nr:RNA polymerase II transcription factor B subunit 3 [Yamadazyma tenuis ATCC 10573]EGV63219.1 RNA polymerase II transcription factor B subunit 3 [Yamadazyma tenuis ATCC 10573]WEJ96961.1 TFIIH/NER complex subunit [Yamadazyma tenuis]